MLENPATQQAWLHCKLININVNFISSVILSPAIFCSYHYTIFNAVKYLPITVKTPAWFALFLLSYEVD